MMKIMLTLLFTTLTACIPDEHKPYILEVGEICISPSVSVQALNFEDDIFCSDPAPNCNARCVYTTEPTTAYCLDREGDLLSSEELMAVDDDGLIRYTGCCPINAKTVAILPVVPGHYIDRDCNPVNFNPVPISDDCVVYGGSF